MGFFAKLCATAFLTAAISGAVAAETSSSATGRPNVIIIVADDQGYHDLGVQGATDIKSPNIDALAAEGVRFTSGYVTCPVCSPSRAGLLTGRYQQRFGHEFNPGPNASPNFGLPTSQKTFANYLKEAGYVTGMVGKWHEGYRDGQRPLQRGFDSYYGFLGGAHSYVPVARQSMGNNAVMRDDSPTAAPPYLTTAFNAEAVQFIEKNHDKPFFLYLAYNAIHTPLQAAPEMAARFPNIKDPRRLTMATMLAALDDGVGQINETLKKHGLVDNTLVFYVSDNGGPTAGNTSRNDPLSGFKGDTLEGGIRIPMIVRWPAKLPKGKVYDQPVNSLDFLPTALAAAGVAAGKESNLEGVDLVPYLTGANTAAPHKSLFWRYGSAWAVRMGDWKLVQPRGQQPHLFNLAQDIGEKNDVSAANPEVVKQLKAEYDAWNAKNVAPLWHSSREDRKQGMGDEEDEETSAGVGVSGAAAGTSAGAGLAAPANGARPRRGDRAERPGKAGRPGKPGKRGKRGREMSGQAAETSGTGATTE